jgi:hypothetical protein
MKKIPLPKNSTQIRYRALSMSPQALKHVESVSLQVQMDMLTFPLSIKSGTLLVAMVGATFWSLFRKWMRPKKYVRPENPFGKQMDLRSNGYHP